MNNFWNLVHFEFKKIFQRKVFWAAIIACLGMIAITVLASVSGSSFWHKAGSDISQFEAMKQDKSTILSGRGYITPELVEKAIRSNQEMISNEDNYLINEFGKHLKEDAYIRYTLPYEPVVNLINVVYTDDLDWLSVDAFSLTSVETDRAIDNLTPDSAEHFNTDLKEFMESMVMRQTGLSAKEIEKNMDWIDQIKTPLYNDYFGGYQAYIHSSKGLALTALFLILILLAPLFSNEYEEKTEQIILCTRNGTGSLCKAKLFVSLTISLLSSVLIMGIGWLSFLVLYGFDGANVNIQMINPSCTYPITLLEACQIHFISVMIASVLFGAFITFLSAKVRRRTSSVVVIGTMITIIPMFIWVPLKSSRVIYNALKVFPVNSVTFGFDLCFVDVFGKLFTPYQFTWAISVLLIVIFFYMAICSFKKHQML